ncbi:MAG: (2Fe-2S)-binding protein [Mycobacteriaceae bacterium]|nr:(2Fe-2S)-binding protein [Mycobacteriaceae bacterium]
MATLIAGTEELTGRIEAVRTALAQQARRRPDDIEIRVAASVAHLGLIARLLAPAIGAVTLGHTPASLSVEALWWQNQLGGPYPLSVTVGSADTVPGPGPAVEAITAAIAERYAVSDHVLWGNVGSAANSAARLVSTARPDLSVSAHRAADAILADPRVDAGALRAGPHFRRRSCCLIYRIADDRTQTCGDCVLRPGRTRTRHPRR